MLDPQPGHSARIRLCVTALADGRWVLPYSTGGVLHCREHPGAGCVHLFVDTGPIVQPAPVSHRRTKPRRPTP